MPKGSLAACCVLALLSTEHASAAGLPEGQSSYPLGGFVLRARLDRVPLLEQRLLAAGWRALGCLSPGDPGQRDLLAMPGRWERTGEILNDLKRDFAVKIGIVPPSLPTASVENCK